jgi:hypothetical protein
MSCCFIFFALAVDTAASFDFFDGGPVLKEVCADLACVRFESEEDATLTMREMLVKNDKQ